MESGWSWDQKSLIGELIQGMELTKQLRAELNLESAAESRGSLVQGILSSYEKALIILKWNGAMSQPQMAEAAASALPGSPISVNESPSSDDSGRGLKDSQEPTKESKKRKTQPRWTEQVKVNSETGFEGPYEDGYSWRKYGQKDILGATYPRSYYRCTFRNTQNCWAVKQVQRSDEDPSVFEITYRGKHTCSQGNYLAQSFHSPEKQEKKENEHDDDHHQKQPSQENLLGYQTFENIGKLENKASTFCFGSTSGGCKNIENSDFSRLAIDTHASLGNFSQSFISPTTPDSNYFTPSPCQRSHVGGAHNVHQSESDVHEIFSANTSATNSPILDWDFPFDAEHINPNFPFNSPGFFY
ncbi:probable WRKY transcription factor 41 [Momordica charantia]|uniref:Probable WRKY transcription factor 41 n=1 Tax=Momordica charantia TaxID=3673 RepID=A0A6J1C3Y5_MOMCH|nr:probable WRKY transcription factor 41 [Momordica charantia]